MDDEAKKEFADFYVEMVALRLIVNEALSVALSHEANPDSAVSLARQDLEQISDEAAKKLSAGKSAEFATWFVGRVRASVSAQLDSIEKRVSKLRTDRTIQ